MKQRIKEIFIGLTTAIVPILSIIILTTAVVAVSDLSALKGTGSSKIGQTFLLRYTNNLKNRNDTYCIQKDKAFKYESAFTLKGYVEINGKEAKVYTNNASNPTRVTKNDLNAQVAYILNKNQGFGTHEHPTDAQNALKRINEIRYEVCEEGVCLMN